ncbi:ExeA family protein, partial [Streptomyces alanosinicus]|uniref:ExeA family protein n=1 Tax=Streptomyces alanosinicus TaxID=68171 RepID=UPI001E4CD3F1
NPPRGPDANTYGEQTEFREYGFTRIPFGRDLAPSMLHQHHSHKEAAARIAWCINHKAIGVVTGEVGAGKTVAVKGAVSSLDPARFTVIYQPNPEAGMRGLYDLIVTHLGGTPKYHFAALAAQASAALAAEVDERGRTPALVLDESHLLDHQRLDAIRMLTNYDMDSTTPFAVLLVGQPTLRKKMKHGVLAALEQRIAVSYQLPNMTKDETASYVKHHLTIAGRSDVLFSDDADRSDPLHQPRPAPLGQQHRLAVPHRRVHRAEEHRRRVLRPRRRHRDRRDRMNTKATP